MPKKCANIITSKDDVKSCPFGLPVTDACHSAGDSVTHMCPTRFVEKGKKRDGVKKANRRVYIHYKTGERCLYAANIMEDQGAVNCDFGDTGAGISMPKALSGSPLYAQTFGGIGLDGLYAFPLGFYADNNESRNLFQGLFSLVGEKHQGIIKEAMRDLSEHIETKLSNNDALTEDERQEIFYLLDKYKNQYTGQRDTGEIVELSNKWNSRKKL